MDNLQLRNQGKYINLVLTMEHNLLDTCDLKQLAKVNIDI